MKLFQIALLSLAMIICSCSKDEPTSDQKTEVIITPKVGLGDLTFNNTGTDVITEYGMYESLTVIRSLNDAAFVMWFSNGLGFQLDYVDTEGFSLQEVLSMASELIDLDQKIIQMIIMTPFEAKTTEDISLGSNRTDVVIAYGEPTSISSGVEVYETLGVNFWYNTDNEVRRIDLKP